MKLVFNIRPPNYVLTKNAGRYSLADLDDEDFKEYLDAYNEAIIDNRIRQQKEVSGR